ncbi:MAG: hypothetical protein WC375_02175 [Methanomassiliicoccales archaeon]|jgi:hypothetical protein
MVDFFTSPKDLEGWIKSQQSPDTAARQILDMVNTVAEGQPNTHEQDIADTCHAVYEQNDENASKILFGILAGCKLTTKQSGVTDKMIKEAQIMRQPGEYPMDLRVCPKLPFSVGKRLISKYNCRHYCLDSIVFDDDPERVYCAEALWRRHIMDKFSREFKDKNGKWVGGYINDRFHVIPDAGTPSNPDVPRDGGHSMELANGERTRKPMPYQFSIERRLSEARGEKTYDLEVSASQESKMIKLASAGESKDDAQLAEMFTDMLDMRTAGWGDEDIIYHVSEHYSMPIPQTAQVYKFALKLQQRHNGLLYAHSSSKASIRTASMLPKTTLITTKDVVAISGGEQQNVLSGTSVVMVSDSKTPEFEIVDGADAGRHFTLANTLDVQTAFAPIESGGAEIQDAAEELGLNENSMSTTPSNDFTIKEI